MPSKSASTKILPYKKHKKHTKEEPKKYYKKKYSNRPLENLGASLGSYFGSTGSKVGKYLGRAAGIITGSGNYQIKKNSLCSSQVPFVHSANEQVRIKHREFLGNINGSVAFTTQTFNINPGLKKSFPWLYSTAASFEQYKIEGMVVQFVSTCGNAIASTNNSLGTVCLSTDYNVVNEDFINMAQCQNSMWSNTAKPSENIQMFIECDGKLNVLERLFLRDQNTVLTNSDLRLYDHCKINISCEGMQVATQIGQLWITYDVIFYKPVLHDPPANMSQINFSSTSTGLLVNPVVRFNYLEVVINSTNNRIIFNKYNVGKKFMILYYCYNLTSNHNWVDLNYTLSGLTNTNQLLNNTASVVDLPFSAGALTALTAGPSILVSVQCNNDGDYIQLSGGVNSALISAELLIFQL